MRPWSASPLLSRVAAVLGGVTTAIDQERAFAIGLTTGSSRPVAVLAVCGLVGQKQSLNVDAEMRAVACRHKSARPKG